MALSSRYALTRPSPPWSPSPQALAIPSPPPSRPKPLLPTHPSPLGSISLQPKSGIGCNDEVQTLRPPISAHLGVGCFALPRPDLPRRSPALPRHHRRLPRRQQQQLLSAT